VKARADDAGIVLHVSGWCLVNADISWVRVSLAGDSRDVPVWRPRPDVQQAMNGAGQYAAWNALCCGVETDLVFEGVEAPAEGLPFGIEVILAGGGVLGVTTPERLQANEEIVIHG
jgi:hypothetical protein